MELCVHLPDQEWGILLSYRDPNLMETYDIYKKAAMANLKQL